MQEVDQILRTNEGGDTVTLYIVEEIGTVLLRPKHTIASSPAVIAQLQQGLGDHGVTLEV
jgi:hypothetical protein